MPESRWEPRSAKEVLGTQVDDTWPDSSLTLRVDVPDGTFGPKHFDAFSACLISALGMDEPASDKEVYLRVVCDVDINGFGALLAHFLSLPSREYSTPFGFTGVTHGAQESFTIGVFVARLTRDVIAEFITSGELVWYQSITEFELFEVDGDIEPTINVLLRHKYRLRDLAAIPATIISCAIDFDRITVWRASHDS